VLEGQLRRMRAAVAEIGGEGWDLVTTATAAQPEASHTPGARRAASQQRQRPVRLGLVLQLSRFPWDHDPAGPAHWLAAVARAAAEAGLQGIALMDHLIQIPQVGRAWEPIPEPWVTLGMLAGLEPGLRLGTLVTPVTFRAPGVLAKTVATLDALSGGRSFCGIGAGWWAREHAGFGLPFPPARSPSSASTARWPGRDPAQAEVTVLDVPVIGGDHGDAAAIVERMRGRTPAADFAPAAPRR